MDAVSAGRGGLAKKWRRRSATHPVGADLATENSVHLNHFDGELKIGPRGGRIGSIEKDLIVVFAEGQTVLCLPKLTKSNSVKPKK